jgi:tetratricopeptide (TPR) repeat protein
MGFGGTRRRLAIVAIASVAGLAFAANCAAAPVGKKKRAPAAQAANADKTRATELYKKSADAYLHGNFSEAIKLLDEAYALDPQPVLVYNQARAHEGLGHVDEAIALYETYLSQEPSSPDRGAIEQRISTLRKQSEERQRIEKERAEVEAKREQQEQQRRDLEKREHEVETTRAPRERSPLPFVVAGVGGAGLVTGAVFGFLAVGKENAGNDASSLREASEAQDTGQAFATVSNISFIVGGVLVTGGAIWWIIENRRSKTGAAKRPVFLGATF